MVEASRNDYPAVSCLRLTTLPITTSFSCRMEWSAGIPFSCTAAYDEVLYLRVFSLRGSMNFSSRPDVTLRCSSSLYIVDYSPRKSPRFTADLFMMMESS